MCDQLAPILRFALAVLAAFAGSAAVGLGAARLMSQIGNSPDNSHMRALVRGVLSIALGVAFVPPSSGASPSALPQVEGVAILWDLASWVTRAGDSCELAARQVLGEPLL